MSIYRANVICERQHGARNVRVLSFLVSAEDEEGAIRKIALDRGAYYKEDRVYVVEEMKFAEPFRVEGHYIDRRTAEELSGRLVSSVLCEIATEKKES